MHSQHPEPVDLSALDPERDPLRWARVMNATRARIAAVLDERARVPDPLEVVSGWYRPIVAIAAALLVLLGAAQVTMGHRGPARVSEARRLASLTESAVLHGRIPSGAELIGAIRRDATP